MAASPLTELLKPETLNPSDSDSVAAAAAEYSPSDPTSPAGTKRKRDSEEQAQEPTHPLWKTSLCSFFRRHPGGSCSHGETCRYAHGESELRMRPDNTWDPTSDRAKKLARDSGEGDASKGDKAEDDVMMTEVVVDGDDDGDEDEEHGDGGGSDLGLTKCLVHLPRSWKSENFNSYLTEQGISFKSAKKKKGMTVGFVSFESTQQLQHATEALQGKSIGNNKSIKVADVIPRPFEEKNKPKMPGGENNGSSGTHDVNGPEAGNGRTARDVVTPLANMPYSDQLEHKKSSIMHLLKKLTRNARKACPNGIPLPEWVQKSREIGGLPCSLEGILASPVVNGYRNKCEFSVGYSLQGKLTVGFMLGNFREGVTAVEEPIDCPNVSSIACKYATIFQEFLQQSTLPAWNRFKNTGFWRQLTVREGRRRPEQGVDFGYIYGGAAEVMLMVQVSTSGFDDTLVTSEFERMAEAFSSGAAKNSPTLPLTGLVVQDHQGVSNVSPADAPLRPLPIPKVESSLENEADKNFVEPRIHDYISNLKFCISPTAFFQVNTLAAEKLYSLAGDWACLGPDTLLFDVCCGTGTIGLTLAHRVGMVVGIEMNASAVSDAQRNAEINGIKNCRFICSKAEDVMASLLKEYLKPSEKLEEVQIISENGNEEISLNKEKDEKNVEESSCQSTETVTEPAEPVKDKPQEKPDTQTQSNENPSLQCFKNVVAIVDPPRGGLHPTVIKALRTHPLLRRLVYISCNPESLTANAIELCTPSPEKIEKGNKNNRAWRNMSVAGLARHRAKSMPVSEPFRPVKAMAVDLFPHTTHCEMVMLFER